jgi:DNA-binding NarL/FixJ family response regulator
MTTLETLRIAVVEDDAAAQDALRLLIDGTSGFRCVGAYGSAELAMEALGPADVPSPDVLLLDINLPGMLGSEAARFFHERHPSTSILMLTLFYDEDRIFESLCNGASGYLLKKTPPARLLEAVREARERGAPLSPDIADKVMRLFKEVRPAVGADLTRGELKLLSLIAEGLGYRPAADEMRVSPASIPATIRSIYGKLYTLSKSGEASRAIKAGLF